MLPQLKKLTLLTIIVFAYISCSKEEFLPKPKAFLRLSYETTNYNKVTTNCPFHFEISNLSEANFDEKCWVNIKYPTLKASLNITYRPVENNLIELIREAEKLTINHAIKADAFIPPRDYINVEKQVYGSLSEVTGNAASSLQFHLTDSTKHFITGALYFDAKPNYDSILPAVKFIEKDIQHIMETMSWK